MATPAQCSHDNRTITTGGPYYRQVHPNNFQDGRALSPAFVLQDTGCHFTLSFNDGARTTAERCHHSVDQDGADQDGNHRAGLGHRMLHGVVERE